MASFTESEFSDVEDSQDEEIAGRSGKGNRKKRSKMWIYFKEHRNADGNISSNCVECTECGKTIKTKTGNTTNLMSHLSVKRPKKHADVKQKAEEEKKRNAKDLMRAATILSRLATLTMTAKKKK